ncbi:MAG TPA: histidine kinase dimerization/phosphoacceptor domain -containing protein, partial [Alphaproteobacteria bacterium]|nr:histidine kinase dimerization/phosphoacceptor domain -containing protein [Alphaproteobacteria bacterium]
DSISMFDRDGRYLYASRRVAEGLGLDPAEIIGRRLRDFGLPEGVVRQLDEHMERAMATGEPVTAEIEVSIARGLRHFDYTMSPVRDAEGNVVAVVTTGRDMTERKRVEDDLRRSLAEKEVLLREVHHRVKNNLQIIVSLVNLQSQGFDNAELHQSYEDLGNRIRALALVHQMLTEGPMLERIDLAHYVGRLTEQLRRFHLGAGQRIAVRLSLQPVTVGMDSAVPLGLIVNELVSNALIHAFPDGRSGTVTIGLADRDGRVELSVADDGTGFDGNVPSTGPGLGTRLVAVLARQIGGEVGYEIVKPGTRVTVAWPQPAA